MLVVNGIFDDGKVTLTEQVAVKKRQKVVVAFPDVNETAPKRFDGVMACLENPWKTDVFTPLKREDIYDR